MSLIMTKLSAYQALPNTLEAEETDVSRLASQEEKDRRPHSFFARRYPTRGPSTMAGEGRGEDEWAEYRPAAARRKATEDS